jgi:hypothetical protein
MTRNQITDHLAKFGFVFEVEKLFSQLYELIISEEISYNQVKS